MENEFQWFLTLEFFFSQSFWSSINFSVWFPDHGLLVDQQWKKFQMLYNMTMFIKISLSYLTVMTHNILSLTWYLISSTFWSHSVLLIGPNKIKNWSVQEQQPNDT